MPEIEQKVTQAMTTQTIETDYLIVGAGAMGMAFADTLLSESDADIAIVDAHHKPGGHWNDAYSFVTLHQPSATYGVSSKELGSGLIDLLGLNRGLEELATGPEILAYYDDVMRRRFLTSGRVQYFPMHEWDWDTGIANSMLGGESKKIKARKKRVDSTWLKTTVPSTHTPNFDVHPDATLRPLNDLPKIAHHFKDYVVCGGGKTGMDAVTWLLVNGCDPDKIRWIMPRDGWLMDRATTQTQQQFFEASIGNQANQMEAIAASTSIEDMFERLEKAGCIIRLDENIKPKMFHGATISQAELAELRRVKKVIRMGRIQRIEPHEIVLDEGTIGSTPETLHVDCTASAVANLEIAPAFEGDLIRLQTARMFQPVFSASVMAYVEAKYEDEARKNEICNVIPLPNHDTDWIKVVAAGMMNQFVWSQDKELRRWIRSNRLDAFGRLMRSVEEGATEKQEILNRMRGASMEAMGKLQAYIKEIDEA